MRTKVVQETFNVIIDDLGTTFSKLVSNNDVGLNSKNEVEINIESSKRIPKEIKRFED